MRRMMIRRRAGAKAWSAHVEHIPHFPGYIPPPRAASGRQEIRLAAYVLTDWPLMQALTRAVDRGGNLRIYPRAAILAAWNGAMEHSPASDVSPSLYYANVRRRLTVMALERFGRRPQKRASKRRVL